MSVNLKNLVEIGLVYSEIIGRISQFLTANNNSNTHICIAPYGRNFRGAVARECARESEKREESKPERKGMYLA